MNIIGLIQYDGRWVRVQNPVRVITAVSPAELIPALEAVETAVNQENLYAVGFITYEASAAFGLAVHPNTALPLLWFGLFDEIQDWDFAQNEIILAKGNNPRANNEWEPNLSATQYDTAIDAIKSHIAQGNTYQVNYTFHLRREFASDPFRYFQELAQAQQAEYMAYLDIGTHTICSASPELFFKLDGDVITSKPMKGTAVRGRTLEEDKANIEWLAQSDKNRAENVMIVDMIRNDMGQIAELGSVEVTKLFDIERYPTLFQMTSTVQATTKRPLSEIMAAMFPCASITGAPKVRTMQLIRELESEARGLYTGSIGMIAPQRKAQFNVAIRTVVIDKSTASADFGVGSGIVWDSVAADEFEECRTKASVLTTKRPSFSLLESLLWEPGNGYFLLEAHLARLQRAAEYFDIPVPETAVRQELSTFEESLQAPCKIRLLAAQTGKLQLESVPLANGTLPEPIRIGIAQEPISSNTIWLYHKTSFREIYNNARASRPDCDDVVLWNEKEEITEASSSNIVLALDGQTGYPTGFIRVYWQEHLESVLLQNGRIQEQILDLGRSPASRRNFSDQFRSSLAQSNFS